MHELVIKQYRSSAYHPENQGALERFHQPLKNMIWSYCFDTEKDWDEGSIWYKNLLVSVLLN